MHTVTTTARCRAGDPCVPLLKRLTAIDATNREQHRFLEQSDRCWFFGEYFTAEGHQGGGTNQLIFNFKCKPSDAAENPARHSHKEQAIHCVAAGLRRAIPRADAEGVTWVPVPASKTVGHPDHDDRLMRSLTSAFFGYDTDVRSLLRQSRSTDADHSAGDRLTPGALLALIELDQPLLAAAPLRDSIVLFDDVLTTGKHFKACECRLRTGLPKNFSISGIFIARRILPRAAAGFGAPA
jgi:hypothetical protein